MTKQFKLTVKGQVTIPKDVRQALGLKPGDRVVFDREGSEVFVRKGGEEQGNRETFDDRLARALRRSRPLPTEMSTDEYMAMIREPAVPPFDHG